MNKILVLYKSRHGAAKQYAEWIASELSADLQELSASNNSRWREYSTIVFCGGVYYNTINGMKTLSKRHTILEGRKTVIVACGLSKPGNAKALNRLETNLYEKIPQLAEMNVKLFLVQGCLHYDQMGFFEKAPLRFLEKMIGMKKPETRNQEEREMLEILGKDCDHMDQTAIQPIVDYCKG